MSVHGNSRPRLKLELMLFVGVISVTLASCASGALESHQATTDRHASSAASSSSRAREAYPRDHLTGFGATRASWDAHHAANADPSLVRGCCYGATIEDPDNGGSADEWNLAGSADNVVTDITHHFAPNTDEATVIAAVHADLPPDAQLVRHVQGDTCSVLIYRSAALAASGIDLGATIDITLRGPLEQTTGDDTVYSSTDVRRADETAGSSASCD